MASNVVEIVDDDDDDEVRVLYSTPPGSTKFTAIPVDNYRRRPKSGIIDLTQESFSFYKGESSNSLIFGCEICVDEKPISDAFRVLGCRHTYCTDCISKYVASKLQDNISTIKCPVPNCEAHIEPHHCRFILPKQVFDRWGDALCEAMILASERFYCPYKDCSALLIHDSNELIQQSECPSCNRPFCASCKVAWHHGIGCADFQKLNKDERSNEDLLLINLAKTKKWTRCPNCKMYVERIHGCLFMRCRCGHNFCYNCGSPIEGQNHYCGKCKRTY